MTILITQWRAALDRGPLRRLPSGVRLLVLAVVSLILPLAILALHQNGMLRAVLSELGSYTALLLVVGVYVIVILQILIVTALWKLLRRLGRKKY